MVGNASPEQPDEMTTLMILIFWSLLIGLAAWWPDWSRRHGVWLALIAAITALTLSTVWRDLTGGQGGVALAGPDAAFLSVWMLVLLPILQRRLDPVTLARMPFMGLIAAAAIGLALDVASLALTGWAPESLTGPGAAALVLAILIILYLAGFAFCLLASPVYFPWDYPAWYAGLLLMVQTAIPLPLGVDPGAGQGLWVLGLTTGIGALLWRALRAGG